VSSSHGGLPGGTHLGNRDQGTKPAAETVKEVGGTAGVEGFRMLGDGPAWGFRSFEGRGLRLEHT